MWIWCAIFIILVFLIKIMLSRSTGHCSCDTPLTGKLVIVTGGNRGIGYETAKNLASKGAKVIIACRDEVSAAAARDSIIRETNNKDVFYKHLDLCSFKSVRHFAEDIKRTEPNIHILINNAGTGKLDNSLTEDNLPIEAQINHYSPYLLTRLLLPLLKKSGPSRIINVSSIMHWLGKCDENLCKQAGFLNHWRVYSNTKLANILFSKELARKLRGTEVTVNCLHPGAVNTDIFRHQPRVVRFLIRMIFKTPLEGAQTTIHLALSPKLEGVSGKYFSDCKESLTSQAASNKHSASLLWESTRQLVGFTEYDERKE